jgi:Na+-translocating ferredoxin:NAD+ oxidoreductase RnfD subunit
MGNPAAALPAPGRTLRIGRTRYPVVLPTLGDPRLHLAAIIVTLQVLGQTALGFEVSVAQILVSVGTCAVLDAAIALRRQRVLMWPASALLTGNGVAFILRTVGTRHGDWWSLNRIDVFVVAAVVSVLSKHLLRQRGRHVFNPSNLGLVAVFVIYGSGVANPQDLWWGSMSPGLVATLAIIVAGGMAVTARLRMVGMVVAFWTAFAACIALLAATGHCMTARWHYGPVCGGDFWSALATSPELLVFLFFMISDPRTAPRDARHRITYAVTIAVVAALLIAPQRSEFATKVALLDALVVACAAVPLLRRLPSPRRHGILPPAAALAAAGGLLLAAGIPARGAPAPPAPTSALADTLRRQLTTQLGPAYRLTSAALVVLHHAANSQQPPDLALEVAGSHAAQPFQGTFLVTRTGAGGYRLTLVRSTQPLG